MPKGVRSARGSAQHRRAVRDIEVETPGTSMYAKATTILGNGRMRVACSDGSERLARVRGSMRRRDYVRAGDMVLVTLRDFEDKVDIIFKYRPAEVAQLQRYDAGFLRLVAGQEPGSLAAAGGGGGEQDNDDCVVFADEDVAPDLSLI